MKKDLIEKLLNEQTTPEEEHLIAQRLQEEEDIEQWLKEDETEAYDRIVSQRSARRSYIRWAVGMLCLAYCSGCHRALAPGTNRRRYR